MKAVVAHAFGPPESLLLEDWPVRAPAPGEVRVRLHSAGISFVDILVAAGKHLFKPSLPFVPGTEFSGEVVEVGAGVGHVACGDPVCGGDFSGILAEEVTVPARRVQRLPAHVSMEQAAVLRASYITAWYSLVNCGGLKAGERVLVLGAAGAVGIAACQVARHLNAIPIGSASSAEKRAFALANGAMHALDPSAPDWRDQVMTLTGGRGIDVVVDPVGGVATESAFRTLAYKGRHLMVGFASGTIPSLPANLPLNKGASLVGVLTSHFAEQEPEAEAAARATILDLFVAGVLTPPVGRVYPLADFVEAMQAATSGTVLGRILLRMSAAPRRQQG
jgi:NADPH2:quinone reductase